MDYKVGDVLIVYPIMVVRLLSDPYVETCGNVPCWFAKVIHLEGKYAGDVVDGFSLEHIDDKIGCGLVYTKNMKFKFK